MTRIRRNLKIKLMEISKSPKKRLSIVSKKMMRATKKSYSEWLFLKI